MALIHRIEKLGEMAERGKISTEIAAYLLKWSSLRGLTLLGALDLIINWRTARQRYMAAFKCAERALASLTQELA